MTVFPLFSIGINEDYIKTHQLFMNHVCQSSVAHIGTLRIFEFICDKLNVKRIRKHKISVHKSERNRINLE